VLALASVIIGVGFGLTAFAGALAWFYAITVLVWTLGEMLQSPSISTTIAELSPDDMRGRYQGLLSLSWSVAAFAAPVLGGVVRETAGNTALWLGVAAIGFVVALAHLLSGPARERRAAELHPTPPKDDPQPGVTGETLAPSAVV
jgi:MFS family permease